MGSFLRMGIHFFEECAHRKNRPLTRLFSLLKDNKRNTYAGSFSLKKINKIWFC